MTVARESSTPAQEPRPEATRLAPSPTGALHLGNARTFLVNWAMARERGWRVVMRIEDLDGPRVKPGACEATLDTLRWLGVDWDGGVLVQSLDDAPYAEAMRALASKGLAYPCELTRSEIEAAASAPHEEDQRRETRFPPELRPASFPGVFDDPSTGWRFVVREGEVGFVDAFAGAQSFDVSERVGDFVVWTKRGQAAYQLAVVVDDFRQGVTQVVRGDDLLDSTARQLLLQEALGLAPSPVYTHLPLVLGEDGRRLAKRHGDTRLASYRERGVSAERVVGLLASWCGITEREAPEEMTAAEFARRLRLDRMSGRCITFTQADEAWLLG